LTNELTPNSTLSHYRIVSKLGAGGMGEVYLAQDTKLDRKVALKILSAEFGADESRMGRFIREAKSVSALNHPNILTIHEIGEDANQHYISTEYIDGETLRRRIDRGPLPVNESIEIACQIGAALNAAHLAGIVHRDIKPENIMIRSDDLVKVLDFGLAKLTGSLTSDLECETRIQSDTQPGMILGTVAYMSPQQARGIPLDARTDVWSLGVVIYEMLSCTQPFRGTSVTDTLANILHREPDRLKIDAPDLEQIVRRLLAKDLEARYASISEALSDLKRLQRQIEFAGELQRTSSSGAKSEAQTVLTGLSDAQSPSVPSSNADGAMASSAKISASEMHKSVAVLPFTNLSADEDNEYFCDGLAEELLNALAKIDDLKVAARTSAFSFKGKNANVSEIGQKLGVKSVLEGSVRKSGNRLRIYVQLINVSDGFQLWSERYDSEMRDVFDVQDEIALAVVDALKLKLFGDEKVAVVKRHTDDAEVHELFLKGRYYSYKYTAEGWSRAIEFFDRAIEKQPDHAPSYAGKAASLGCLWYFGLRPAEHIVPQFKSAAKRALELDEKLAEAHLSLGLIIFFHDWEWKKAEEEFKKSIQLNPRNAEALSYYAMFLGFLERFDEAIILARRALEVDPLSPLINMNVGWTYFSAGLIPEVLDQTHKMIEMEPEFFGAYWLRGATHLVTGEYEKAVEHLAKAVSFGGHPIVLADLGAAYALTGEKATAETILEQLLDLRRESYVPAISIARVYSRLGKKENAIEWLEKAYDERNGEMVLLESELTGAANDDPLNTLATDPRIMDLLERMKLPLRAEGE
jgi:eukaryotic-like serine/threonine-protein kinase